MKILHFNLLLLFMVVNCKSENNSTTILPTSGNSTTVSTSASAFSTTAIPPTSTTKTPSTTTTTTITPSTTTTLPPTTTTTTTPSTTTTAAITTTTPYDDSKNFDYQVCGNVTKTMGNDCTCNNGTLHCQPLNYQSCWWYCSVLYPPFNSTNIKIMNESFIVKTINFWRNQLRTLKKGKIVPGHEHTVETLKLSANTIHNIENGIFDKFIALKSLDLSDNYLRNVSPEVLTPQLGLTLERLDISDNILQSILDFDFSNLVKLNFLSLQYNQYLGRNDSFSKYVFPEALANLTSLNLARCGITAIGDDTFMNLRSLEILIMYSNPIITFPRTIYSLQNLKHLDLDNTQITTLNYTETNATMKLEKFSMCNSLLNMIDDCAFCSFPELKELHLYNNLRLSYIHENAFGYAYNDTSPPLQSFSLELCNLSTIPEELINWHNISQFGLGNNPFMCNCSMAWLINDLLSPTHSVNLKDIAPQPYRYSWEPKGSEFKCARPYTLREMPFVQLSRNFCPNEIKKEKPVKEKIVIITEPSSPYNISWFHVSVIIVASLLCLLIGMIIVPLFRCICRRPKIQPVNGFFNQNFHDDMNHEDFDDYEKA